LLAAVRPEFRVDELLVDAGDPIFAGLTCPVEGCARPQRSRGLCHAHHDRWVHAGKPDLDHFVQTTPGIRGSAPLPACQVPGCQYGCAGHGLCARHVYLWRCAGNPPLAAWLAEVEPPNPRPEPVICLVPYCQLWARTSQQLCQSHLSRWRFHGCPDIADWIAGFDELGRPSYENRIDLRRLAPQLRLEMQYALQCRRDDGRILTRPTTAQRVISVVADAHVVSLLDLTEAAWAERVPYHPCSTAEAALLRYARRKVDDLRYGTGWESEYARDVWRLRDLGVPGQQPHVRFDRIPQPWLKDLAKRWTRWRISAGARSDRAYMGAVAITQLGQFLAQPQVAVNGPADIDRPLLERYLADLHTTVPTGGMRRNHIGALNAFFQAIRQHHWDDSLPPTAMFFPDDYPKDNANRLPRALAEHVMTQVENPANLDRWDTPANRLITVILIRCGLRISDAVGLPHDCIVHDRDGAPYLRYHNHKMKREALVPIDDELKQMLIEQQQRTQRRWPNGTPVLLPRRTTNPDGSRPASAAAYRSALYRWVRRCDIRDERGQPVHLTPHQWRHTLGTRLINRDVPQEVVRRILDHDSHAMTAHYARLHDTTARRHWEAARKVNIDGADVTLDPDGPVAEAAWAKQRLGRATQALPNGYCGLPVQKSCPHANACFSEQRRSSMVQVIGPGRVGLRRLDRTSWWPG
jgi:integrase